jgi:hypothetical protein
MPWAMAELLAEMAAGAPPTMLVLLRLLLVEKLHGVEAMLAVLGGRWCTSYALSKKDKFWGIVIMEVTHEEKTIGTTTAYDFMNTPPNFRWYLRHMFRSFLTVWWPLGCPEFIS